MNTDNNSTHWLDLENDHDSSLSLKFSLNLELLVNQFNNATPENSDDPKKFVHPNIMTYKCIMTYILSYKCCSDLNICKK